MPGPVALLLRGAAPRLLAVVLLVVGLVSMHTVAHAAATHATGHTMGTTTSTTVTATTTGLPPAPSHQPCHDGGGSEAQCTSTVTQTAVAQEAAAAPPGSLLLPLAALPHWPAPHAAARPPAPVSLRVILRT